MGMLSDYPITETFFRSIWKSLGGDEVWLDRIDLTGKGITRTPFAESDLTTACFSVMAAAVAELIAAGNSTAPTIEVNRGLCTSWLGGVPGGHRGGWLADDPNPGDFYELADGRWARIHNSHIKEAIAALGLDPEKASKADIQVAMKGHKSDTIEQLIHDGGGLCAVARTVEEWNAHPQGIAVNAEPITDMTLTNPVADDGWRPHPNRPLAGIRVLDVTRVIAGPTSTRFLAAYGAEVLRIDPPGFNQGAIGGPLDLLAGKRCAYLDMKTPEGRDVFLRLVADCDILVHGLRPGAMEGLGLDGETLHAARPGLVEVRECAFGWSGPWQSWRGYNVLCQTASGMAIENRKYEKDGNPKPLESPTAILDLTAGFLLTAAAIHGLTTRLTTGQGSRTRGALARMSSILTAQGCEFEWDEPEVADPFDGPWGPNVYATPSGPVRRPVPPIVVDGAPMFWERPGEKYGSSAPVWAGLREPGRS